MKKDFSTLTILYVEDEDLIRQNAVEYLARICAKVLEAKDGVEALQVYHDNKPDIIISDINMPRLNGLDMARKIRKDDKITPIIIATAHTEIDYLLRAVELQLIKYLVKPITAVKLKEALSLAQNHLNLSSIIMLDTITSYDTLNKVLLAKNSIIKLTRNELLLLNFLIKNRQRTVTYQEIESLLWLNEGMSKDALRSLITNLRKKLPPHCIENISGIGYRCKTMS